MGIDSSNTIKAHLISLTGAYTPYLRLARLTKYFIEMFLRSLWTLHCLSLACFILHVSRFVICVDSCWRSTCHRKCTSLGDSSLARTSHEPCALPSVCLSNDIILMYPQETTRACFPTDALKNLWTGRSSSGKLLSDSEAALAIALKLGWVAFPGSRPCLISNFDEAQH